MVVKDVRILVLVSGTCDYVIFLAREIKVADGLSFANQLFLDETLDYLEWTQWKHESL